MSNWLIALLIVSAGLILYLLISRHQKIIVAAKSGDGTGVQLRKAAENIPIYGTFVKAAGTVGKPVNTVLNKANAGITTGLQHIPVVGTYLAMPNQIAGSAVHKINNWLGLD
jgi:hypothetical protein